MELYTFEYRVNKQLSEMTSDHLSHSFASIEPLGSLLLLRKSLDLLAIRYGDIRENSHKDKSVRWSDLRLEYPRGYPEIRNALYRLVGKPSLSEKTIRSIFTYVNPKTYDVGSFETIRRYMDISIIDSINRVVDCIPEMAEKGTINKQKASRYLMRLGTKLVDRYNVGDIPYQTDDTHIYMQSYYTGIISMLAKLTAVVRKVAETALQSETSYMWISRHPATFYLLGHSTCDDGACFNATRCNSQSPAALLTVRNSFVGRILSELPTGHAMNIHGLTAYLDNACIARFWGYAMKEKGSDTIAGYRFGNHYGKTSASNAAMTMLCQSLGFEAAEGYYIDDSDICVNGDHVTMRKTGAVKCVTYKVDMDYVEDSNYYVCEMCNCRIPEGDAYYENDTTMCESCYSENYKTCVYTGDTYHIDDLVECTNDNARGDFINREDAIETQWDNHIISPDDVLYIRNPLTDDIVDDTEHCEDELDEILEPIKAYETIAEIIEAIQAGEEIHIDDMDNNITYQLDDSTLSRIWDATDGSEPPVLDSMDETILILERRLMASYPQYGQVFRWSLNFTTENKIKQSRQVTSNLFTDTSGILEQLLA